MKKRDHHRMSFYYMDLLHKPCRLMIKQRIGFSLLIYRKRIIDSIPVISDFRNSIVDSSEEELESHVPARSDIGVDTVITVDNAAESEYNTMYSTLVVDDNEGNGRSQFSDVYGSVVVDNEGGTDGGSQFVASLRTPQEERIVQLEGIQ